MLSWGPEPSQPPHHFYSLLLPAHTSRLASLPVWATRKVLFRQAPTWLLQDWVQGRSLSPKAMLTHLRVLACPVPPAHLFPEISTPSLEVLTHLVSPSLHIPNPGLLSAWARVCKLVLSQPRQ